MILNLRSILGCLAIGMLSIASGSAAPMPVSYDMPNGESGTYTYFDDSYSGTGDKTTSLSALSGGLGDLTDGVLATAHWYDTPGAYVGWANIAPVISFNFASTIAFLGATLYFDDQNGEGFVFRPTSIEFDTGSGFQTFTPTITVVGPLAKYDFDLSGTLTSNITARLNHPVGSSFIMLTEVTFAAVPEPATWMLLMLGLGLVGFASNHRRAPLHRPLGAKAEA